MTTQMDEAAAVLGAMRAERDELLKQNQYLRDRIKVAIRANHNGHRCHILRVALRQVGEERVP